MGLCEPRGGPCAPRWSHAEFRGLIQKSALGCLQYLAVTGNDWAFTLTGGALGVLVVLYFHQLGYAPMEIALLFLFWEFPGSNSMTSAAGCLFGTLLSGRLYQASGIEGCLHVFMTLVGMTAATSPAPPRETGDSVTDQA